MFDSLEKTFSRNNETCFTVQSPDDKDSCQLDGQLGIDRDNTFVEALSAEGEIDEPDLSLKSPMFFTQNIISPDIDIGASNTSGLVTKYDTSYNDQT